MIYNLNTEICPETQHLSTIMTRCVFGFLPRADLELSPQNSHFVLRQAATVPASAVGICESLARSFKQRAFYFLFIQICRSKHFSSFLTSVSSLWCHHARVTSRPFGPRSAGAALVPERGNSAARSAQCNAESQLKR